MFNGKNIFCIVLNIFLFFLIPISCTVVSFEHLDVNISIQKNDEWYEDDFIFVDFSIPVDIDTFKQIVSLKKSNTSLSVNIEGTEKYFRIQPKEKWKKGQDYTFTLTGPVTVSDGRIYSLNETRHFNYGMKNHELKLISFPKTEILEPQEALAFIFSKPIVHTSFIKAFSISPYTETRISFSTDNCTATIEPLSKWELNTIFSWNITEDIISEDEYIIDKSYTGSVRGIFDTSLPEVTLVCPAIKTNQTYTALKNQNLNTLIEQQCIFLNFSKPMDINSVESNLTFEPYIKGNILPFDDTDMSFIFEPNEIWKLETEYSLTIGKLSASKNGLKLYEDYTTFFTPKNMYINLMSIKAEGNELLGAADITSVTVPPTDYLFFELTLSCPINQENKSQFEKSISLSPVFPLSASHPNLTSISWNLENTIATLQYTNFSHSQLNDTYYQLKIKGKENGVLNSTGEYLEEDICVTFIVH